MKKRFQVFVPRTEVYEKFIDKLNIRTEIIELNTEKSIGYAAAEDILSPENLPGFDKSTIDGYAVIAEDTFGVSDGNPAFLKIVGEVFMGEEYIGEIKSGECVKIPTGGMLPDGANACIMIENTKEFGKRVEIYKSVAPGENILKKDEDVKKDSIVVKKGEKINTGHIHNLMSLGITKIKVYKKPKVCIVPTGDEVVEPSENRIKTQIRDGNSYALMAWLKLQGIDVERYRLIKDDPEEFKEGVKWALENGDIVVISGGSSLGSKDYSLSTIEHFGEVLYNGVQVKPGKPVIFGKTDEKIILGLPGNPTSFVVSSYLFLFPTIRKISGFSNFIPKVDKYVRISTNVPTAQGRERFIFVKLERKNNEFLAHPILGESGIASPFRMADGIVRIPLGKEGLYKDEICEFYSFKNI
ncbi:molybdopterin molybdochelatase [Marinitoga hydrogenitolerans DSM 16785]|uniref:Molybdopterin molybdenumtransferase n=1 Tax=Marinitoga hydrogenitolerans (strain DSM 16785 / JCM 12826 / AT1271) TaxID=1122195 RepID=A0A1M5A3I3_MARH1|nr:gephyrin-like molybdotransferase Glp [Marinitoga hydrogenitolerans]SHF24831.1 molybdopterin molybdochelatase [Marinitoga hydrogenitolerans DSM 16785]